MRPIHAFRDLPEVIALSAGDYAFHKGESGKTMCLVIEGEIDLLTGTKVVETATKSSFVGGMALIEEAPRSASARARTPARVFPIDLERFHSLVQETPSFALDLMQTLARRLRRTTATIARAGATKPIRQPTTRRAH